MSEEDMEMPGELEYYAVTHTDPSDLFVVRSESHRHAAIEFAKHFLHVADGVAIAEVRQRGVLVSVRRVFASEDGSFGQAKSFIIAKVKVSPYVAIDPSAPSDTENA